MSDETPVDLSTTLGAAPLTRDLVTVVGPDAESYLQGQLSQDVAAVPEGSSSPAFLLQPTGKLDAWLRLTRTGPDAFLLDVDPGFGPAVLARLQRFKLRTKADLEPTTRAGLAVRGPGAEALAASATDAGLVALHAGWPGVEGIDVLSPDDDGGQRVLEWRPTTVALVDPSRLDALRIEVGVPAMGAELSEATIPAEGGQWLIDASVSFTKGCYTGQELVARIDSRGGNVPRPVRGLRLADAPGPAAVWAGASVELDGAVVGTVTSAASSTSLGGVALGLLARTVAIGAEVQLAGPAGHLAATVAELPLR